MNTLTDSIVETRATFKKMIIEIKDITETDIIPDQEAKEEMHLEVDLLQKFLKKCLIF